jgi:hypothetical protein
MLYQLSYLATQGRRESYQYRLERFKGIGP